MVIRYVGRWFFMVVSGRENDIFFGILLLCGAGFVFRDMAELITRPYPDICLNHCHVSIVGY
jgi:hypothetical protein